MDYEFIRIQTHANVATLLLDRAPGNLLDIAMLDELNDALLSLRGKQALQFVVLRGAAGEFCAGLDLSDHVPGRVQRLLQVYMRVFETIRLADLISIAAVEGRALGAGFELALGCNLIVAHESAEFALPQIKAGIIAPVASAILPRIAPRRKAMEWILTGRPISARRLEHDGVINRLFPDDAFESKLEAFVAELAGKSGPVLQLAKRAQFEAYYATFPDALANIHTIYLRELMSLQDAVEGPAAVRENREPVWQHC